MNPDAEDLAATASQIRTAARVARLDPDGEFDAAEEYVRAEQAARGWTAEDVARYAKGG